MVNTSQQIGGAVGAAALSTIFTSALTRYMTSHPPVPQTQLDGAIHGYTTAFGAASAMFLAGAVLTAALLRSNETDGQALRTRIAELEAENRFLYEALHSRDSTADSG
jgi:hypothetical protein